MSAGPQPRSSMAGFAEIVDEALSAARMNVVAHPEDWPDPMQAPGLPRGMWDRALGDIARDILGRPSRQFRARLCALAWRVADGRGRVPPLLPAIVEIIHAGSLIVDDIEDASAERRGARSLHLIHGVPRALNTANWMYFWAMDLVDQLDSPPPIRERIRSALGRAMYRCHLGQAIDLSASVGRIPPGLVYRTVATSTMLKTGALMEVAAAAGAIAADASSAQIDSLARFGRRLGLGLQMLDDFGNLTARSASAGGGDGAKALEDLRNGRPTWPWAHAALELDESRFAELQVAARMLSSAQDVDGTRARALAAKLRIAVGLKGRREAARYLRQALADLRDDVGDRAELFLLGEEIERVEASYG